MVRTPLPHAEQVRGRTAPDTGWLSTLVELDARGFVRTGPEVGGRMGCETSRPAIFAVGNVRAGSIKHVASAMGEAHLVMSAMWSHTND